MARQDTAPARDSLTASGLTPAEVAANPYLAGKVKRAARRALAQLRRGEMVGAGDLCHAHDRAVAMFAMWLLEVAGEARTYNPGQPGYWVAA